MKVLKIVGTAFSGIGALFLALGIFFFIDSSNFKKETITAQGLVVDEVISSTGRSARQLTPTHYPVVRFGTATGDTVIFKGHVGSYPPKYYKGQAVPVRYRPEDPQKARIDDNSGLFLLAAIFSGIGGLFFLLGLIILWTIIRKNRGQKWLQLHGQSISAEVTGIEKDRSYTKNGLNPYRIEAQWQHPEHGTVHVFRSEAIWFDPTPFVHQRHVSVKIDYDKPARHLMDIAFLPPSAEAE